MWRQGKKSARAALLGVSRGARGRVAAQAAPPAAGGCAGKVWALPGLGLPLTPAVQQVLLAGADSCGAVLARSCHELCPSWARRCTELAAVPGTRAADEARGQVVSRRAAGIGAALSANPARSAGGTAGVLAALQPGAVPPAPKPLQETASPFISLLSCWGFLLMGGRNGCYT